MKTIHQLVQEHIARSAALVQDPLRMSYESEQLIRRLANRMHEDPALLAFTTHYSQALAATLRIIPDGLHASAIQSLLVQAITEWEDVNLLYNAQLATAP